MYYVAKGSSTKGYTYQVILKLYRGCEAVDNNHAALDSIVAFSVYDNDGNTFYKSLTNISLDGPHMENKQRDDPCILNPPAVCYEIGYYRTAITLPLNKTGYTIAFQRCCRNDQLLNVNTSSQVGATYYTVIPGTDNGVPGDNSPVFDNEEAVLICSRGRLEYNYAATDPDTQDSLVYAFHPGNVGGRGGGVVPETVPPPPYNTFRYLSGFSAMSPLGPGITIDPSSGRISGRTNLEPGSYDVCVSVSSYRKGKLLGVHLKDFQVDVHDCRRVVLADIPTLFNDCRSATISFPDNSTPGKTYLWDFGDGETSSEYTPTHRYRDTGVYHVWLKVDPSTACGDSIEAEVRVYPGLKTGFTYSGSCLQFPTKFTEATVVPYGHIDSRSWDFGVPGIGEDTSDKAAPVYQYTSAADYPVRLTITTDKGCEQSDTMVLDIYDKPPLEVTRDTILCYKDAMQLSAGSTLTGSYLWQPAYAMTGVRTATPTVHPLMDTTYRVTFTDTEGCVALDSVRLRVKHELLVDAGSDTVLCQGDPLTLAATSDENYAFTWYDDTRQVVAHGRVAGITGTRSGRYTVAAALGSCEAESDLFARVVPYPEVTAAPDTGICYGDQIRLRGTGGAFYRWFPGNSLSDSTVADPLASPTDSTLYTLTVTDTLGCPKPVSKSILVNVVPPVPAFAGNDTIITTGQTFQLHATGGNSYAWTPPMGLSDPDIANPVVTWDRDIQYEVRVTQQPEGCFALDSIRVRYIVGPEIYVPTAFSPNGDGMNDRFRPIPVGVTRIDYFKVYNRWGQLMFYTNRYLNGWDGTFKGKQAPAGGYVWMVKGEDYNGKVIFQKGPVLLIR